MKAGYQELPGASRNLLSDNVLKRQEMEQAVIRLAIGGLLIGYYAYGTWQLRDRHDSWLMFSDAVMAVWLAVCITIIIAIRVGKPVSVFRRLAAITADVANTTYFIYETPDLAAPLYCLYLWFIIGHGFRFGAAYLYYTLALAFSGFISAVLTQSYWEDKMSIGVGLAVGMVAISLYLAKLVQRLTQALKTAEAANLAKRQFVSSISHEIRTPLNAIIGMSDLLRSSNLDRQQKEMVHSLDSASKLLLALVDDVLDFSKIEAGKLTVEVIPFDLSAVVGETLDLFRHQAEEKSLALQGDIHPDVPTRLMGDPTLLRQVLTNFLSNAIKFTSAGSVTLRVAALSVRDSEAQLLFEVEDTGIGISPRAKAHIFDSFTQADPSTTRKYGGTGLGTTIAKQIVELMEGRIGFRSTDGGGSTFWFELKLGRVLSADPLTAMRPVLGDGTLPAPMVRSSKQAYSVLVADDNETNRRVIDQILVRAGHSPVVVRNGEEALDMLEQRRFDIAILDMNMPDMSGIDVFRTYQFTRLPGVALPFIMLSADVSQDLQKECLNTGFDAFLAKPIQSDTLLDTITSLVEAKSLSFAARSDAPAAAKSEPAATDSTPCHTIVAAPAVPPTFIDFSTLDQLDRISQNKNFVDSLIDNFSSEAAAVISEIECALALSRPAEAKRIAHALKGTALGAGALGLSAVCDRIDKTPVSQLGENAGNLVSELLDVLSRTNQLLAPYRLSRQGASSTKHLHSSVQ